MKKPYVLEGLSGNRYFLVYVRKDRTWKHVYLRKLVGKRTPDGKYVYRYEDIERDYAFKVPGVDKDVPAILFSYENLRWRHEKRWIEKHFTLRVMHDYKYWEYPPGQWKFGGVWK